MDDAERAFRDALHRVDSVKIPVPSPEAATFRRTRGRGVVVGRWLAAAAAVAIVAGLGAWVLTVRGQPMTAVPAAPASTASRMPQLTGAAWGALELFGQAVVASGDQVPFVVFAKDSTFTGGDPCNHVGGTYSLVGDELRLTRNGAMTEMGCNVAQQGQFLKVLDGTRRAQRTGDTLVLMDASGNALGTFRATLGQDEPGVTPTPSPTGDPNLPTQGPEPTPTRVNRPDATVDLRIRNDSRVDFTDVYAVFPSGTKVHYGPVRAGGASRYESVVGAYSYSYLKVTTADRSYVYQPDDYLGETELPNGRYGYALDIVDSRIELTLERG